MDLVLVCHGGALFYQLTMPKNFKIYSSDQLFKNKNIFKNYVYSFNKTFNLNNSNSFFIGKYKLKNLSSVHVFCLEGDNILGAFTIIPRLIHFNNKIQFAGMCCDTFVLKQHRNDELLLKKMFDYFIIHNHHYSFDLIFGIPNVKASLYWEKLVKWKKHEEFKIQIIPSIFLQIKPLSIFLILLFTPIMFLFDLIIPRAEISSLRDLDFIRNRFDKEYKLEDQKNLIFSKVYKENNFKIKYLFGIENIRFLNKLIVLLKILLRDKSDFIAIGSNQSILPFFKIPSSILKRKMNLMFYRVSCQNNFNHSVQLNLEFFDNR